MKCSLRLHYSLCELMAIVAKSQHYMAFLLGKLFIDTKARANGYGTIFLYIFNFAAITTYIYLFC
jgi:hypothetical protein